MLHIDMCMTDLACENIQSLHGQVIGYSMEDNSRFTLLIRPMGYHSGFT